MPVVKNAGLRSDGELVQAFEDDFEFISRSDARGSTSRTDADHRGWIEILDVSAPTRPTAGDDDDDNGLPDTIIWCIDGNGTGSATGEELMLSYEFVTRTWAVDGEVVDNAGMSALLFL